MTKVNHSLPLNKTLGYNRLCIQYNRCDIHQQPRPSMTQIGHLCLNNSNVPDSKVHGANMGPTLVLSAPDGPHVGPMNLVIWECML